MVTMEVLLQNLGDPGGDPLEVEVTGDTVESLKDGLSETIIQAVRSHDREPGRYSISITFTENGEYIDSDEMDSCYCDPVHGTVKYEDME
jgi:hypothetical protein